MGRHKTISWVCWMLQILTCKTVFETPKGKMTFIYVFVIIKRIRNHTYVVYLDSHIKICKLNFTRIFSPGNPHIDITYHWDMKAQLLVHARAIFSLRGTFAPSEIFWTVAYKFYSWQSFEIDILSRTVIDLWKMRI